MLEIGKTLVSLDILEEKFVCDLSRCKGACCVAGDSGAPLLADELEDLNKAFAVVKDDLSPEGREAIAEKGIYLKDSDGDWVTPLIGEGGACAFTLFEKGIARCSIEKAWLEGRTAFRKPISCHLYPIRIGYYKNYDALNYERWEVCKPGCQLGKSTRTPLYVFLKEPLIRKYGQAWYDELCEKALAWLESREKE